MPPSPEDLPPSASSSSPVHAAEDSLPQEAMLGMDRQLSSGSQSGSVGSMKSTEGLSTAPGSSSSGEGKAGNGGGSGGSGRAGKPSQAYIEIISKAILATPERKLLLKDIYQYIKDNYPYYNNDAKAWRNSVRHNLSLNECFIKMGRAENGKGNFWTIHPANLEDFANGDFRRRQARRRARKSSARETNISSLPQDYRLNLGYVPMTASPQPFHSYSGMPFCKSTYSPIGGSAHFLDYSQAPSSSAAPKPQALPSLGCSSQATSRMDSIQSFRGAAMLSSSFNNVRGFQGMEAMATAQRSPTETLFPGPQGYDLGGRMSEGGDMPSLRLGGGLQSWGEGQDFHVVGRHNATSQRLSAYCLGQEQARGRLGGDLSPELFAPTPQSRPEPTHWSQECY